MRCFGEDGVIFVGGVVFIGEEGVIFVGEEGVVEETPLESISVLPLESTVSVLGPLSPLVVVKGELRYSWSCYVVAAGCVGLNCFGFFCAV